MTFRLLCSITSISVLLFTPSLLSAQEDRPLSHVIELLDDEQAVFGIISSDRSLTNARSLSRSGLDFIIIDMEHGAFSPETLRIFLLGMTDKQRIAAAGHTQMAVTSRWAGEVARRALLLGYGVSVVVNTLRRLIPGLWLPMETFWRSYRSRVLRGYRTSRK